MSSAKKGSVRVQSLYILVSTQLSGSQFAVSNKIIILNLQSNILIKMFYACVYASVAIFSLNLYILKFLHCITAVFYGNKFKLVRIATDTLTFWTIIQTIFNSQMYILYRVTNSNISNNFTVKMMPVLNDRVSHQLRFITELILIYQIGNPAA